jgi:hypothetical protein
MFEGYPPRDISSSNSYRSRKYLLAVLRNPDIMNLQVRFGMGSKSITSHSDILNLFFAYRRGVSTVPGGGTNEEVENPDYMSTWQVQMD